MPKPTIILASSSVYRQALLQRLRLNFTCESPDIDESPLPQEAAKSLVQRLATQKAQTIANNHQYSNTYIIGSDQVATLEGSILSKPHNHKNAVKQLNHCNGKTVSFVTGLCLFNCNTMTANTIVENFSVTFRQLTAIQIENYLRLEEPYDCAGSFKMEGLGISLFKQLQGDDPNSLIGLPLIKLNDLLLEAGIDTLS